MNAHNKTQLTHAMTYFALKGSSNDSPLSKILNFTILASNVSSSSRKVLKFPHTKMIQHLQKMFQHFIVPESHTTLTLTKISIHMASHIGFPFYSKQYSLQLSQDQKVIFKPCNRA